MRIDDEDEVETLNISSDAGADDKQAGLEAGDDDEDLSKLDRGDEVEDEQQDDPDLLKELAASVEGESGQQPPGKGEPEKGSNAIPYARFKEVNDENKELRDRLARLEGRVEGETAARAAAAAPDKAPQAKKVDLDALEEEYQTAILEADGKKARELRAQIREEEIRIAEERALKRVEERDAARAEKEAQAAHEKAMADLQVVAAAAMKKFPQLDLGSEKPDRQAIADVRDWRDVYIQRGHPPAAALAAAVRKVMGDGKAADGAGKPAGQAQDPAQQRKQAAVERNVSIEKRIPPQPGSGAGGGAAPRVDFAKLSDAEFDSISEAELKKARGD